MSPEDFHSHHENDDGASFPRHFHLDDTPHTEPMKGGRSPKRSWNNLRGSVQRFLQARINQPWEAVHRELLATFGPSGISPRLLEQRIPDLVELDVIEEDGELMRRDERTMSLAPLSSISTQHAILYVCPATRHLRRYVPEDTRHRIQISESELVRQIGKRWYALTLSPIPTTPGRTLSVDVVLRCPVDQATPRLAAKLARLYGRAGVFASEKRQVGKAELERLRAGNLRACRLVRLPTGIFSRTGPKQSGPSLARFPGRRKRAPSLRR